MKRFKKKGWLRCIFKQSALIFEVLSLLPIFKSFHTRLPTKSSCQRDSAFKERSSFYGKGRWEELRKAAERINEQAGREGKVGVSQA